MNNYKILWLFFFLSYLSLKSQNDSVPKKDYWQGVFYKGYALISKNGLFGLIDSTNKIVIPIKYQEIDGFPELAERNKDGGNNSYCGSDYFMEDEGLSEEERSQQKIFINYRTPCGFKHGLIRVKRNYKYGFVNKKGEEVIYPKYTAASRFYNGRTTVGKLNKYGIIDTTGKEISPLVYDYIEDYDDVYTAAIVKNHSHREDYIFNKKGKELLEITSSGNDYERVTEPIIIYEKGFIIIWHNPISIFDTTGRELISFYPPYYYENSFDLYSNMFVFENNWLLISFNDYRLTLLDRKGKERLLPNNLKELDGLFNGIISQIVISQTGRNRRQVLSSKEKVSFLYMLSKEDTTLYGLHKIEVHNKHVTYYDTSLQTVILPEDIYQRQQLYTALVFKLLNLQFEQEDEVKTIASSQESGVVDISEEARVAAEREAEEKKLPKEKSIYDRIIPLSDRFFIVERDNKVGIIDSTGKILVNIIYDDMIDIPNINQYRSFTNQGKEVLKPSNYSYALSDSLFVLEGDNHKKSIIDINGKETLPIKYDYIYSLHGHGVKNSCIVKQDHKYGIITTQNKEIIPIVYDKILFIDTAHIWVEQNSKYGLIDINNNVISPFIYSSLSTPDSTHFIVEGNGKYGILDVNAKELLPVIYDYIGQVNRYTESLQKSHVLLRNKGKYGISTLDGKIGVPVKYDSVEYVSLPRNRLDIKGKNIKLVQEKESIFFKVKLNNKHGFLDSEGREILPIEYDMLPDYLSKDGRLCVPTGDGYCDPVSIENNRVSSIFEWKFISFFKLFDNK